MTDTEEPPPIAGGAVSDDDDDFGAFEDAVTEMEDDPKAASESAADQMSDESNPKEEKKANGSSSFSLSDGLSLPSPDKVLPSAIPAFNSLGEEIPPAPPLFETEAAQNGDARGDTPSLPSPDESPEMPAASPPSDGGDAATTGTEAGVGSGTDEKKEDEEEPLPQMTGAMTVQSGEGTEGDDDPSFGAFDSIAPTADQPLPPLPAFNGNGAADNGVNSAPTKQAVEVGIDSTGKKVSDPGNDDDDFGSFDDAAVTELQEGTCEALPVGDGGSGNEGGDFGAFSGESGSTEPAAPKARTDAKQNGEGAVEDDDDGGFGGFGSFEDTAASDPAPPAEPVKESADAVNTNAEDDGFGDFGAFNDASPSPPPEAEKDTEQPVTAERANEEPVAGSNVDEFGDFGSFDEGKPQSSASVEDTKKELATTVDGDGGGAGEGEEKAEDNDFGDFGSFNEGSSGSQEAQCAVEETKKEVPEASDDAEEDGEFGDFGSFDGGTTPEATKKALGSMAEESPPKEEDTGEKERQDDGDDDGFGDFEDTATPAISAAEEKLEEPPTQTEASGKVADDDDDDDEFGDFGDFDEAPAISQAKDEKPSEAPAPPHAADGAEDDDDDFGDFGDFDDAGGAAETAAPESPPEDPFVAKTRTVLDRVFAGFAIKAASSEPSVEEDAFESMTLESVLSSIPGSNADNTKGLWSKRQVESILSELDGLHSTPQSVISNHDIPRPYVQYTTPMGGLHLSEDGVLTHGGEGVDEEGRGKNGQGGGKPVVPDVLSINLPTGPESPTPPKKPVAARAEAAATVVALPKEGREKKKKKKKAAVKAKPESSTSVGEQDFDTNFGGFESSEGSPEKAKVEGSGDGDTGFDADFGGFETAKDHATDSEGGVTAACKDFLRQIPDLSFMLKSSLSLPTGSHNT